MRFANFLKTGFLLYSLFLFSCGDEEAATNVQTNKPAQIIDISPNAARVGESIIISGKNFLKEKDSNKIWFAPNIAATIDLAEESRLFCTVPKGAESGKIIVSTGVNFDTSEVVFKVIEDSTDYPVITSFSPGRGYEEATRVFVKGSNFTESSTVIISGIEVPMYVYSSQPYFVVPKGAKTGKICIKNEKGKTACSQQDFQVLKGNTTVSISLGGIKGIRKNNYEDMSYDLIKTKQIIDTIPIKNSFNFSRCVVPNYDEFYNIGYCFAYSDHLPFPDSVLQCFEYRSNYPKYDYVYQAADVSIDSTTKIIKYLKVNKYQYLKHDEDYTGYRHRIVNCNRETIVLTNVPYQNVLGKIKVSLNSTEILKYVDQYYSNYYYLDNKEVGRWAYSMKESIIDGIHEILPDAYFEMTLE